MESREMVLRNLLTGQQWRNRHREQTYRHGERGGEVRCMEKVTWKLTQKKKNKKAHTYPPKYS